MHKTLQVMRSTKVDGVELASYRLKGVAYSWFEMWEDSRDEGSPPVRWNEFADAFIDHFLPAETKEAHAVEFEMLIQGSRNVWDYHMEFVRLSKYVVHMMPTMEDGGICPSYGGSKVKARDGTGKLGNLGDSFGGGRSAFWGGSSGSSQSYAQSSASAPPSGHVPPPSRGFPVPTGHGAARGGAQSSGGPSLFYAMSGQQSVEASPDVITGILTIQSYDVYALIDPGSSLSYVTPYIATSFGIEPEQLHEPFSVSTPIGTYDMEEGVVKLNSELVANASKVKEITRVFEVENCELSYVVEMATSLINRFTDYSPISEPLLRSST
ncbi:uncharacterized protein [Nicotiana tomentosiformis]|uniref:uncharacterized protein n=1 Tax=Nicotiana tomentosiformis TaxID=4098 RepID=UPI00388C98C8